MQNISVIPDFRKLNPANKVYNGDFEYHSGGAAALPNGWALEGTPTLVTDTGDIGFGLISQKITATGANLEGIAFTLTGLKPLTIYSVIVRTKVTAGDTSQILTTGAGINMAAVESMSTTWEAKVGKFVTDNVGTAVVLKLMAKTNGDIVWFDGVQVNEGAPFSFSPPIPILGDWIDKTAGYANQQALTDGFILVIGYGTGDRLFIKTDSGNPATVFRARTITTLNDYSSLMSPVKKFDYWLAGVSGATAVIDTVYFIPLS
jgi:hypothetical protein